MPPRYKVTLTQEERGELEALTKNGRTTARSFVDARALLLCDAGPRLLPEYHYSELDPGYLE
jgi:hypothetical protein